MLVTVDIEERKEEERNDCQKMRPDSRRTSKDAAHLAIHQLVQWYGATGHVVRIKPQVTYNINLIPKD